MHDKYQSTIEQINRIIDERGLKQSYIADKIGIRCSTMSRVLNGKRNLKIGEFLSLCDLLNINPMIFLDKPNKQKD